MRLFGFEITRHKPPQTQFLGDLVKVKLEPGDVCVLMARQKLSQEGVNQIAATFRAVVGDEVTCLVLDSEMKLGVLSPPQAAAIREKLSDQSVVAAAVAEATA